MLEIPVKSVEHASCSLQGSDEKLRSFISVLQNELQNVLHVDMCFGQQAAAGRLYTRAPKKMVYLDNSDLDIKARDNFRDLNDSILSRNIDLGSSIVSDASDFIRNALEQYTCRLNPEMVQSTLDLDHLVEMWRFGPGSAAGVDGTHFAEKLCASKPSVTSECSQLAKLIRFHDPRLRVIDAKENKAVFSSEVSEYMKVVAGSSLFTVPKSEDTRRTACTEPLMNMCAQLCCGAYIQGALKCIGLDIESQQDINKDLARLGSISGRLATIDLKSASDLIQPALIKLLWPEPWYDLLMTCRSTHCKFYSKGDYHKLNMMSTMGNGFTFPMMTLTLLALVYAVQSRRLKRRFYWDPSETAVYGDDIIVPVEDYVELCSVLESAGLIVNSDKSFATGAFRESCGGDFAYGMDITPFYVKSLYSDPQVYVAINQVLDWSVKTGVWLTDTLQHLGSLLHRPGKPFLVPEWESPDSGVLSPKVPRRYKRLDPIRLTRLKNPLREIPEALMLMITGGFVESQGHLVRYTVRSTDLTEYKIKTVRMPSGFLAGTDSSIWTGTQTEERLTILFGVGFA